MFNNVWIFSPWTEDDNIFVPSNAVCLVLTTGLNFVIIFPCIRILCRRLLWERGSEEKATDAKVAEEEDAKGDETPEVQEGGNEGVGAEPEEKQI